MTVRVANDFKTETQVAYENLVMDNKVQRDKIRSLEQEIVKLNKGKQINRSICLLFIENSTSFLNFDVIINYYVHENFICLNPFPYHKFLTKIKIRKYKNCMPNQIFHRTRNSKSCV